MRLLIFSMLFLGFASIGQADQRFYVGVHLGMSQYDGTADASQNSGFGQTPPAEISISGLPFESDETAWGVYGGWKVKDWLAVELGFNDLGNTGRETFTLSPGLASAATNGVAVDVEEFYLGSKFSLSLSARWRANWTVGITRATFASEGKLPLFFIGIPLFGTPRPITAQSIPYASPDDQTGFLWGFGFGWDVSDRWGVDIGYRQHDTRVFNVDTFAMSVLFSF